VAFSGEPVGWQVTFEGAPITAEAARPLIELLARQIGEAAGEACEWIEIA
jgi:hypothetical protein